MDISQFLRFLSGQFKAIKLNFFFSNTNISFSCFLGTWDTKMNSSSVREGQKVLYFTSDKML